MDSPQRFSVIVSQRLAFMDDPWRMLIALMVLACFRHHLCLVFFEVALLFLLFRINIDSLLQHAGSNHQCRWNDHRQKEVTPLEEATSTGYPFGGKHLDTIGQCHTGGCYKEQSGLPGFQHTAFLSCTAYQTDGK